MQFGRWQRRRDLTFSEPDGTQVYGRRRDVWYGASEKGTPAPDGSYTLTNTFYDTASTIMGYGGSVVPYFSNPTITVEVTSKLAGGDSTGSMNWGVQALGRPVGDPKAAYNAKVLVDNAPATAALTEEIAMPAITQQPADTSAASGEKFSLQVTATGGGLSFQWKKDGTAIAGATAVSYTKSSATSADAGSYSVTITNRAGTFVSSSAAVSITAAVTPTPTPTPGGGPKSPSAGGGGGGGGAISTWFVGMLALLAVVRLQRRQRAA